MDLFRLVQSEADQALLQAQISTDTALSLLSQPRLDLSIRAESFSSEFTEITEKTMKAFENAAFVHLKE